MTQEEQIRLYRLMEKLNWFFHQEMYYLDRDIAEQTARECYPEIREFTYDILWNDLPKEVQEQLEADYEILTKQFIHRFNSTEKELLDELNMERSVFYDRKREAIFLLSLCLFGYAVPELQEELEMPRLYPD